MGVGGTAHGSDWTDSSPPVEQSLVIDAAHRHSPLPGFGVSSRSLIIHIIGTMSSSAYKDNYFNHTYDLS